MLNIVSNTMGASTFYPELQKRADRADQSVFFFLVGANFWEKHAKNRRKHAKNRRIFGANFLGGKIGRY